jgi:hypothetical protein
MDRAIQTVADGVGHSIGWLAEHGVLFVVFAILWGAFAVGLVLSQGSVDQAWQAIRELPLLVQLAVWVLFLPVMAGLWVWESGWPLAFRLVLLVGIASWNLLVFLPQSTQATQP